MPPAPSTRVSVPKGLTTPGKALWRASLSALREQGTWQDSDVTALDRYVRAMERVWAARALVKESGVTARGSQGQLVQHPNVKTLREAERDSRDFAVDLLLTPQSRNRAQVAAQEKEVDIFDSILG